MQSADTQEGKKIQDSTYSSIDLSPGTSSMDGEGCVRRGVEGGLDVVLESKGGNEERWME